MSTKPSKSRTPSCSNCERLELELARAVKDRDEALLEVARAKEISNALRLLARHGTQELALGKVRGAPLRYVVVDEVNDTLKTILGPMHGQAKKAVTAAVGAIKGGKKK
jgi:hypothetical protein